MGADKESLVWACSLARWVPGNTWIFNMIVYPLCCVNSTLTVSGLRHSGTLCFGTWYLLTHHTWQPLPLWLQNRETSLFTRYERGSLTIWGLMKFPWIRNASACQTFGWKSFEIWSVWADKPVCFCRLPLITSNITHKTLKWSFYKE